MCQKMFVLFTIALCCLQSSFVCRAAEADWEVLNFAISNPGVSNPEVLKNSILNILGSFVPQSPPTAAPAPTTTTARTVPPVTPTAAPTRPPVYPYPIYWPHYHHSHLPHPQVQPVQPAQQVQPFPFQFDPKPADCGPKQRALADFLVNVPCPTTTPKPIKQIVVRVPCPTTTKKPCECQCCPCNPCPTKAPKPSKVIKKARKESSEEESLEQKTVYRSYDPVMRQVVAARSNFQRVNERFE